MLELFFNFPLERLSDLHCAPETQRGFMGFLSVRFISLDFFTITAGKRDLAECDPQIQFHLDEFRAHLLLSLCQNSRLLFEVQRICRFFVVHTFSVLRGLPARF